MLTAGWINECFFICKSLNKELKFIIEGDTDCKIECSISTDGVLNVYYVDFNHDKHIWQENLISEVSNFGVESCDAISRCIYCLSKNDENWRNYVYFEDPAQNPYVR